MAFPDLDVKDFTAGTAKVVKGFDLGSSKLGLAHIPCLSDGTAQAPLHAVGTSGFLVTPFTLISSTELSAKTAGQTSLSAASGTSGVFSQTNFGSARKGLIYLTVVTAAWTPTAGGNLTGWFLHSYDGGTNFEALTTNVAVPRAPDFIIPFTAAALNVGDKIFANGMVDLPFDSCKVVIQNNSGATTGTGNHTITCAPVSERS